MPLLPGELHLSPVGRGPLPICFPSSRHRGWARGGRRSPQKDMDPWTVAHGACCRDENNTLDQKEPVLSCCLHRPPPSWCVPLAPWFLFVLVSSCYSFEFCLLHSVFDFSGNHWTWVLPATNKHWAVFLSAAVVCIRAQTPSFNKIRHPAALRLTDQHIKSHVLLDLSARSQINVL